MNSDLRAGERWLRDLMGRPVATRPAISDPDAALQDMIDAADYAVIGPVDGRRRVHNADRMPYRAICFLARRFSDRVSGCSGALIHPRIVLTAGHCLTSRIRGGAPLWIDVQPGRNGASATRSFRARRFLVPAGYAKRFHPLLDYGLIILPRPIAPPSATLPIAAPDDATLTRLKNGHALTVAGYPADKPRGTMWTHDERLLRFSRQTLLHTVDTCPGHSGSAILAPIGGRATVIGIHVAGVRDPETGRSFGCTPGARLAPREGFNRGVRITPALLASIFRRHDGNILSSMKWVTPIRAK